MDITNQSLRRHSVGPIDPISWVDVDGVKLAVSRRGAGFPMLCLHATGHGGRDFEVLTQLLENEPVEIITLDWPGQGRSEDDASDQMASALRYAQLLNVVVPKLFGDKKIAILGNSIGGAAAIRYAHASPDQVAALIISNGGGLAPMDWLARTVIGGTISFFGAGERGAGWFPRAFGLYYKLVLPAAPAKAQRGRIIAASGETAPVIAQAWRSFAGADDDIRPLLSRLQIPIFFAWAKQDRLVAYKRSRAAIEAYPHTTVELFPGGHSPFLEAPEAFAASLTRFLRLQGLIE